MATTTRKISSDPALLLPEKKENQTVQKACVNLQTEHELRVKNLELIRAQKEGTAVLVTVAGTVPISSAPTQRDLDVVKRTAHAKIHMAPEDVCQEAFRILHDDGESALHEFLGEEFWRVRQIPGLYEAVGEAREKGREQYVAPRIIDAEALRKQIVAGSFDPVAAEKAPRREKAKERKNDPDRQRRIRNEMKGASGASPSKGKKGKKNEEKKGKNKKK